LLEPHHLPRDELRDSQSDDLHGSVNIGNDASHLLACQSVRFGSEAKHYLVAIDGVDIEMDIDSRAASTGKPVEQGRLVSRKSSGLKTFKPHSAMLG
jgi:hypothetical protein